MLTRPISKRALASFWVRTAAAPIAHGSGPPGATLLSTPKALGPTATAVTCRAPLEPSLAAPTAWSCAYHPAGQRRNRHIRQVQTDPNVPNLTERPIKKRNVRRQRPYRRAQWPIQRNRPPELPIGEAVPARAKAAFVTAVGRDPDRIGRAV